MTQSALYVFLGVLAADFVQQYEATANKKKNYSVRQTVVFKFYKIAIVLASLRAELCSAFLCGITTSSTAVAAMVQTTNSG